MKDFIISQKSVSLDKMNKSESILCLGNGYLGIRNASEESYMGQKRGTLINGIFDKAQGETTEIALLPEASGWDILLDGETLYVSEGNTGGYENSLNMKTGEANRSFVYTLRSGKRAEISIRKTVSMSKRHITAVKIVFRPFDDMKISVKTGIDGSVTNSGTGHFGAAKRGLYNKTRISASYTCLQSGACVSVASELVCNCEHDRKILADKRGIYIGMELCCSSGGEYICEKITSYSTSRDIEYKESSDIDQKTVEQDNIKRLTEACALKYDGIFEESMGVWQKFWEENSITVKSENDFYQKAINFMLYHLNIMSNKTDDRLGIGAKGLSGEIYGGHSFWDTEIFVLPYFIYTSPEAAKNLLIYRYRGLKAAENKAKSYGFSGAMYPWESAWEDDGECCPDYFDFDVLTYSERDFPVPRTEIHITAAIAFAVQMYYRATGDEEFMKRYGYEIIIKTADFWQSRADYVNGRYEYLNITGPDEYKDEVDNNAYTNYLAYHNMKLLIDYKKKIPPELYNKFETDRVIEKVENVLSKLYLPEPDGDGIIPQNDGYRELTEIDISGYKNTGRVGAMFKDYNLFEIQKMQVGKQADVIMLFVLFPHLFDEEIIHKNYDFYEKRTLHDSSLSMCMHALMAAKNRMYEEAETFFRHACEVDFGENTKNSDAGIHSASIGGIWQALVFGWAGLEYGEDSVIINPILPGSWQGYSFSVVYKGSKIIVTVSENDTNVKRISGDTVKVILNGNEKTI